MIRKMIWYEYIDFFICLVNWKLVFICKQIFKWLPWFEALFFLQIFCLHDSWWIMDISQRLSSVSILTAWFPVRKTVINDSGDQRSSTLSAPISRGGKFTSSMRTKTPAKLMLFPMFVCKKTYEVFGVRFLTELISFNLFHKNSFYIHLCVLSGSQFWECLRSSWTEWVNSISTKAGHIALICTNR